MKEDSLISSTASLASLSKAVSRGHSGSSGADKYTSPLDHPWAGSFIASGLLLQFAASHRSAVVVAGA